MNKETVIKGKANGKKVIKMKRHTSAYIAEALLSLLESATYDLMQDMEYALCYRALHARVQDMLDLGEGDILDIYFVVEKEVDGKE